MCTKQFATSGEYYVFSMEAPDKHWFLRHKHFPRGCRTTVVDVIALSADGLGFDFGVGQFVHSVANGSPLLCCPDAKPRRRAPPLVTPFDVIPRV